MGGNNSNKQTCWARKRDQSPIYISITKLNPQFQMLWESRDTAMARSHWGDHDAVSALWPQWQSQKWHCQESDLWIVSISRLYIQTKAITKYSTKEGNWKIGWHTQQSAGIMHLQPSTTRQPLKRNKKGEDGSIGNNLWGRAECHS